MALHDLHRGRIEGGELEQEGIDRQPEKSDVDQEHHTELEQDHERKVGVDEVEQHTHPDQIHLHRTAPVVDGVTAPGEDRDGEHQGQKILSLGLGQCRGGLSGIHSGGQQQPHDGTQSRQSHDYQRHKVGALHTPVHQLTILFDLFTINLCFHVLTLQKRQCLSHY
jgi:hypothetical protein